MELLLLAEKVQGTAQRDKHDAKDNRYPALPSLCCCSCLETSVLIFWCNRLLTQHLWQAPDQPTHRHWCGECGASGCCALGAVGNLWERLLGL
jgi:hypothetical protein